jgi:UDPglucose--hexose-1-phosphate uridylyltransferase
MSDLRYDPVFDVWAVIAENRRDRPIEFVPIEQVRKPLICPFCAGNEDETPPPVLLFDAEGEPLLGAHPERWTARVFPNRYPTFSAEGDPARTTAGPYSIDKGSGVQELVIPTPRHVASLSELNEPEWLAGLLAARTRVAAMQQDPRLRHTILFGNCRFEAGASVEHVHFQLIGSPLVSPALERRAERMRLHHQQSGQTMLEAVLAFEELEEKRLVARTRHWSMFCPLASRVPFQVWIVPVGRTRRFAEFSRDEMVELGRLTGQYVTRLESLLGTPGYNWMVHELPFADTDAAHCFIEVTPRLAKLAGYELGTDIWVNPVSPETAARRLR